MVENIGKDFFLPYIKTSVETEVAIYPKSYENTKLRHQTNQDSYVGT